MIKVLLVDDNPDLLEMVCLMLQTSNFEPYCILNGHELFNNIEEVNPDIVLMDIFLGDDDGRELCKRIKTRGKYSTLPVLLYSAGDISDETIHDCGADAFIKKPFDMETLTNEIKALTSIAS